MAVSGRKGLPPTELEESKLVLQRHLPENEVKMERDRDGGGGVEGSNLEPGSSPA